MNRTIRRKAALGGAVAALLALAGLAQSASAQGNLLTNPGAETGDLTGWTIGGPGTPIVDNGTFDSGISPHSGTYDFTGRTGASDTLTQTVSLTGAEGLTAAQIDSGQGLAEISFWEQGLSQGTPSDNASVTVAFYDSSGANLGEFATPTIDSHSGDWQQYIGSAPVPVGSRSASYAMNFVRNSGSDLDAFVDDNSLALAAAPEPSAAAALAIGALCAAGLLVKSRKRMSRSAT